MAISMEQLEAFVAAAEHGSFSAAARVLRKAQSAVSTHVANLEADLGLSLFSRAGRHPALTAAGQPGGQIALSLQPLLVRDGDRIVLIDTGAAGEMGTQGKLMASLKATGVEPGQVTDILISHYHGDHIGGLMGADGTTPTFANARYMTGATEHNYWSGAANEGFDKNVKPLNDKITFLDTNGSVTTGITGMDAFGHSPGHMVYHVESDGQRLMITADTANHYVWSLQKPDWDVRFDADKPAAAAVRKQVFGQIAADRIPFIGYHMPFPGVGYIEAREAGFHFVPASYQLMLNG